MCVLKLSHIFFCFCDRSKDLSHDQVAKEKQRKTGHLHSVVTFDQAKPPCSIYRVNCLIRFPQVTLRQFEGCPVHPMNLCCLKQPTTTTTTTTTPTATTQMSSHSCSAESYSLFRFRCLCKPSIANGSHEMNVPTCSQTCDTWPFKHTLGKKI